MILTYINKNEKTINSILKNDLNISSRLLSKLINMKRISLNNCLVDTREIAKVNDIISIDFNYEEDNSNILPNKINLNIIYEDEALLIINKPAGISVHPSILHYSDSLSNGIRYYYDSIKLKKKIRPVNRLDLNTSGLVVFAKNEYIQECFIKQMNSKTFKKEYLALAYGTFSESKSTINAPIARKNGSIIERCISEDGQKSITHFEIIKTYKEYSLVKCILETGRTHQIRVHMSYIGHPLVGDSLYGEKSDLIDRQALHCYKLSFIHPITKKQLEFICDLPKDINNLI